MCPWCADVFTIGTHLVIPTHQGNSHRTGDTHTYTPRTHFHTRDTRTHQGHTNTPTLHTRDTGTHLHTYTPRTNLNTTQGTPTEPAVTYEGLNTRLPKLPNSLPPSCHGRNTLLRCPLSFGSYMCSHIEKLVVKKDYVVFGHCVFQCP